MNTGKRISKAYLFMNQRMHSAPKGFGASGYRWVAQVDHIIHKYDITTWLDYGCGQETLWKAYIEANPEFTITKYVGYDPAIKGKDKNPQSAQLVTNTDVLEHVEPIYLDAVLQHL